MRIAALQMTATPHKSANLATAHDLLRQAMKHDPDLVAFPESFSFLSGNLAQFKAEIEPLNGVTVETLREWAIEYNVWILGGSVFLKSGQSATNTSLLITSEGLIAARYDKIHLFDAAIKGDGTAYRESKTIKPGKKAVVAKTPWGRLGLSVCYDLRFPELYRKLADQGADVIFAPAAFTAVTGKAHWDVLTRARAIENQAYVVAPAQWGSPYPGRETHGHTRIIDPWGRVIAEQLNGPGVVWADLDFNEMKKIRQELPALKHRRI